MPDTTTTYSTPTTATVHNLPQTVPPSAPDDVGTRSIRELRRLADEALKNDQFEDARSHYQELERLYPKRRGRARDSNKLGICHFRLGDLDAAEQSYRVALGSSLHAAAHYNIACIRCLQSKPQEALDELEVALKSNGPLKCGARQDDDLKLLFPSVRFEEMTREEDSPVRIYLGALIGIILGLTLVVLMLPLHLLKFVLPAVFRSVYGSVHLFILRSFSNSVQLHDLEVGTTLRHRAQGSEHNYQQVDEALKLIERCDPRRYQRLRQDLDRILISEMDTGGSYIDHIKSCHLNWSLFAKEDDDDPQRQDAVNRLASIIVHEACHARLYAMGLNANHYVKNIHRHEQLCCKQQTLFLEKAETDSRYGAAARRTPPRAHHYGVFNRFTYEAVRKSRKMTGRLKTALDEIQSKTIPVWERFAEHVWSSKENYVEYLAELRDTQCSGSEDPERWFVSGYGFGCMRRYADALLDLERSLELDETQVDVCQWLGTAAVRHDKLQTAFDAFERELSIEPTSEHALRYQIWLSSQLGMDSQALEYGERLVAAHPDEHGSWCRLAETQLKNELFEEAWNNIEKTLEYHPDCARGLLVAHRACRKSDRDKDADEYWQQYLKSRSAGVERFKKPIRKPAVIVAQSIRQDDIQLRLLVSPSATHSVERLHETADRLLQETEPFRCPQDDSGKTTHPTLTLSEDYLYSMVYREALTDSPFPLPLSVAGHKGMQLVDISLAARHFENEAAPTALDSMELCFDRKKPTSFIAMI